MFVAFSANRTPVLNNLSARPIASLPWSSTQDWTFCGWHVGALVCSLRVLNIKDGSHLKLALTGTHLDKYWGI